MKTQQSSSSSSLHFFIRNQQKNSKLLQTEIKRKRKIMELSKEIMGFFLLERYSLPCAKFLLNKQNNSLYFSTSSLVSQQKRRVSSSSRRIFTPMAVISENLVSVVPEKTVKFKVRAVVTIKKKNTEDFKETLVSHLDNLTDKIGRNVVLQLLSTEIDPRTEEPKRSNEAVLKDWSKKSNIKGERVSYTVEFMVDSNFGVPGAITVVNKHQKEFFLDSITVEGFACGAVHFYCNSWVQSNKDHPEKRVFFTNMPYLPSDTPVGLKKLREKEMIQLRGDGTGVRKFSDRIYDYDTYNDLGNPDKGIDMVRPTLGGEAIPYPRRCRTGRVPTEMDPNAESRIEKPLPMYVPRDEAFEELKRDMFSGGRLRGTLHNLLPSLVSSISAYNHDFKGFTDIDSLYKEGLLQKFGLQDAVQKLQLPKIVHEIQESSEGLLKYDTPMILAKDRFSWLRDDEFARQTLAGINPVSIQKLEVFPPVSKLDPEIYGPLESAFKEEHIIGHLNGLTVQQALEQNKLFMLDFHDIYLPFVEHINALDGNKTYATRALFFLGPAGTLKPIGIELSLPPLGSTASSKRIVSPPVDATSSWVWQLAKAHVCSNDAGAHQLVNHWLRTHAAMEPFIIAAHRQMSTMHPIFKLLDPHMRYTLEINALARQSLISVEGVIETCFTPGKYKMEISAAAYKNTWRFDLEDLPSDLIRRGMAVEDPTEPHGLKLLIEDYPYATDGLLIWSAIEKWVETYVHHYYPDASQIQNDTELQAWYKEAVHVGHADICDASWWPKLENADALIKILSTIIWLSSAQHAALNFGQYPYGGYVPNRPPLMRRLIPEESHPEYKSFLADPQKYYFSALPSLLQASKFMAVVDTLSTHSPDEEYLGERNQPSIWSGDAEIVDAFYEFSAEMQRIEKEIEERNCNPGLKNRCGAGVIPYELLAPSSGPGVTCRGIPNSITI